MRGDSGFSVAELLVVLFLGALALLIALPSAAYVSREGKARAGARQIAVTFGSMRWKSVATRKSRGMWFEKQKDAWVWWEVEDGNGNHLRVSEIRRGVDPIRSGPHRLGDDVSRVELGFPPIGSIPRIPPSGGTIATDDPVQFGSSDIVSFAPTGSASSGTLYLSDGSRALYGVVLFGPTARVRVWRYDAERRRWNL